MSWTIPTAFMESWYLFPHTKEIPGLMIYKSVKIQSCPGRFPPHKEDFFFCTSMTHSKSRYKKNEF